MLTKNIEEILDNIAVEAESLISMATSPEEARMLSMLRFLVEANLAIVDLLRKTGTLGD